MKIYIQDHSWAGCLVVVANSEAEARALMEGEYNYSPKEPVEEHEIKPGFKHANYGDG